MIVALSTGASWLIVAGCFFVPALLIWVTRTLAVRRRDRRFARDFAEIIARDRVATTLVPRPWCPEHNEPTYACAEKHPTFHRIDTPGRA